MKKLSFFIIFFLPTFINAQVTHSLGFNVGLANVYYKAQEAKSKSYFSIFMPTFQFDYVKQSANTFWGGATAGVTLRRIPFHKYQSGQTTGIDASEGWLRVRAGLKADGQLLSFLPFLGLGIATYGNFNSYSKDGTYSSYYYLNNEDSVYKKFTFQPFVELGVKMINRSFLEDKRNVSISFVARYYPTQLFENAIVLEYLPFQFKNVQYNLIEFGIIAAIQHNFHK